MRKLGGAIMAATVVLSLSLAGAASAQTVISGGVVGGVAIPTGDLGDFAKMGIGGGAGIGIRPNGGNVGIRLAVGYHQFSVEGAADGDPKLKFLTPMASLTYRLATSASVTPYLLGGAGIMRQSYDGESESAFAWQGGAGLIFGTGATRFFVEAIYTSASKDGGTSSFMPIQAGVSFRLK